MVFRKRRTDKQLDIKKILNNYNSASNYFGQILDISLLHFNLATLISTTIRIDKQSMRLAAKLQNFTTIAVAY